jgi:7-carboxy-7-deazaguanine synthase
MDIRLAEEFYSINGEGHLTGVPTYFVRFAGCSVSECPLHPYQGGNCDTDWQYQFSASADDIADRAQEHGHWLCITGGEPADQPREMDALIAAAHKRQMRVTVQTSGTKEINAEIIDWLVVSPKCRVDKLVVKSGHELKVINNTELAFDFGALRGWHCLTNFVQYYIQPEWDKSGQSNLTETVAMVSKCSEMGLPYKLSLQAHKFWGGR